MATIYQVIQHICLSMENTEEVISHSFPTFKTAGKVFATFSLNHHGDEKVALQLNIGTDMQKMLVDSAPAIFYIPPYTGPKGWVGIELNKGLAWNRVAELAVEAYQRVAPANLARNAKAIEITKSPDEMTPEQINPLKSKKNSAIINQLNSICTTLPEVSQDSQFGNPCFRAGKKSFCCFYLRDHKPQLQVWVGSDSQPALISFDQRFSIPPYTGHNGWIDLDLSHQQNWQEIEDLLLASYKHFAIKRMINALAALQ